MQKEIRPLKSSDRPQWEVLWRGYQAYYEVDLSEGEDALFARLMSPNEEGPFCLVYELNDKIIGITQYLFHQTTFGSEPRCYLHDLYTDPASRGKRIGEALIKAVGEAAEKRGASQVYWLTQDFNHTARKLYDRVGELTPFIKYKL